MRTAIDEKLIAADAIDGFIIPADARGIATAL